MKSIFLVTVLLLIYTADCLSQPYKYRYYLDDNLNMVAKDKASVTGRAYWDDDGFRLDCFGNASGQLLLSAYFTDSTLSVFHGRFITYFTNGFKESEGSFVQNEMNGLWQNWDNKGLKTDSGYFEKGIKVRYAKFGYYGGKKDRLTEYSFNDSLAGKLYKTYFSEEGYKISEVEFTGEKGLHKIYDSTGLIREDSVFTREEREAEFGNGGDAGWMQFLQRNLDTEVPGRRKAPPGNYTAIVRFVVDKDGSLTDIKAETKTGYGTEEEIIRVIKRSPKWKPAKQYGRFVKAYRRQPITFAVSSE